MKNKKDKLWEKGYFAETLGSKDMDEKMRTFDMKHDEEMNFNCKRCNKKISAHNNDWHNGMCDECFNKQYYPENSSENPFSEKNSMGECRSCKEKFSGKNINKHITKCLENYEGEIEAFLLKAFEGPFWVYFSVPKDKKLIEVDRFLRELWLECCGHLSAFYIGSLTYQSYNELDEERNMNFLIKDVIKEHEKFRYEYDFGTTTEIDLKCISSIKTNSKEISILARNNILDFRCDECNEKAQDVCVQCIWEGNGFLCKACMKKHKCEEPSFLPIVNSPRIGMCGFTGKECKLLNK